MGSPLIPAAQQIDPEDGNVRPVAGPPTRDRPGLKEAVERVTAALRDLQYGTVTVVVQDGGDRPGGAHRTIPTHDTAAATRHRGRSMT